jgi:uncharacterized protein (DUF2235 family)
MALFAFDGTWNEAKDGDDPGYTNTNVKRFYDAYHARSGTHDFYVAGVGTRFEALGRILGGAFGLGELPRLNEAYDHLCEQWAAGDHVIDIVGFSRGAATTLDFCHIIRDRRIRRPHSDTVVESNPEIRFLGVWDVVAAFGLANLGLRDLNIGHHLSLPRSNLRYAFHALALDERRPSFLPTRLHGAYEVWFRGAHSDVGGGNGNRGLNDIALTWMMHKAIAAGLPIAADDVAKLSPDPACRPKPSSRLPLDIRLVTDVDTRHYTAAPLDGCRAAPDTCRVETLTDEQQAIAVGAGGIETLPREFQQRAEQLQATALYRLEKVHDFPLSTPEKDGTEGLLSLIETRIPLVTDDAKLVEANASTIRLVDETVRLAKAKSFHAINDFFVNQAIFNLRPVFPYSDQ